MTRSYPFYAHFCYIYRILNVVYNIPLFFEERMKEDGFCPRSSLLQYRLLAVSNRPNSRLTHFTSVSRS